MRTVINCVVDVTENQPLVVRQTAADWCAILHAWVVSRWRRAAAVRQLVHASNSTCARLLRHRSVSRCSIIARCLRGVSRRTRGQKAAAAVGGPWVTAVSRRLCVAAEPFIAARCRSELAASVRRVTRGEPRSARAIDARSQPEPTRAHSIARGRCFACHFPTPPLQQLLTASETPAPRPARLLHRRAAAWPALRPRRLRRPRASHKAPLRRCWRRTRSQVREIATVQAAAAAVSPAR